MVQKKILLVEDDEDIREYLSDFLLSEGYLVNTARNGREALDLIEKNLFEPHLILLDLMMPVMDGLSFLQVFQKDHPDKVKCMPVIVLSAGTKIADAGITSFIKKPLDIDDLLSQIEKHRYQ